MSWLVEAEPLQDDIQSFHKVFLVNIKNGASAHLHDLKRT
jgi:hypothetical protein